jgi:hypothetical protein
MKIFLRRIKHLNIKKYNSLIPEELKLPNMTMLQLRERYMKMTENLNKEYIKKPTEGSIEIDAFFESYELKLPLEKGIEILKNILNKIDNDSIIKDKMEELKKISKY